MLADRRHAKLIALTYIPVFSWRMIIATLRWTPQNVRFCLLKDVFVERNLRDVPKNDYFWFVVCILATHHYPIIDIDWCLTESPGMPFRCIYHTIKFTLKRVNQPTTENFGRKAIENLYFWLNYSLHWTNAISTFCFRLMIVGKSTIKPKLCG